jgi:hypothetical protein
MYSLYPSEMSMEFGSLPYNDIKINVKDFSIERLQKDTGFFPRIHFENIVHELHSFLSGADGVN